MDPSAAADTCRTAEAPGTLCALVAIKSRAHCKSRLAEALAVESCHMRKSAP